MNIRKKTIQVVKESATVIIDEIIKQRYRTSKDEYMSRDYDKEIKKEISKLREQFTLLTKTKTH